MFKWPRKSKSTSGLRGNDDSVLWNFWNFYTIHVIEVRESIADISTELPCLDNLENPGKLPVQDVIGGTGECVL